jgi:hypothetical protein
LFQREGVEGAWNDHQFAIGNAATNLLMQCAGRAELE